MTASLHRRPATIRRWTTCARGSRSGRRRNAFSGSALVCARRRGALLVCRRAGPPRTRRPQRARTRATASRRSRRWPPRSLRSGSSTRGCCGLDQPLVEILPADQQPAALTREHTLHHLLSHTSGLANYHDDDDPTLASFLANWDRIPVYHIRRPADMLPLFPDLPAVAPPGTEVGLQRRGVHPRRPRDRGRDRPSLGRGRRRRGLRACGHGRHGSRGRRPRSAPTRGRLPDRGRPAGRATDEHLQPHGRAHARRRDDHDARRPRPAGGRAARRPAAVQRAGRRDDPAPGPALDGSASSGATAAS